MERRVVVTGMGAVSPVGNNISEFWESIKNGKCGIDFISNFDKNIEKNLKFFIFDVTFWPSKLSYL